MKVLSRLDVVTRQWHADLDAPWLDLYRPSVTRADYVAVLFRTFGFVAPLESACRYTPGLDRLLDTRRLTRAGLLAQDLLTLGLTPSRVARAPQCLAITTFTTVPEALGWLYVVERMAQVQTQLRDHLVSRLPGLAGASVYLAELGGRARDHREALGRALDRVGALDATADEILGAACVAFTCAKAWGHDLELRRNAG